MGDDLSPDDAPVKHALDGDRLSFYHGIGVLAARPEIDQRTAAPVIEDELVAEDLGDRTFHGSGISVLQFADGARLQQHHVLRLPALGKLDAAGARRRSDGKHGKGDSRQQVAARNMPARGRRWVRILKGITFAHRWLLSSRWMERA
jgi:hypothetical protein